MQVYLFDFVVTANFVVGAALVIEPMSAAVFVAAMLVGMAAVRLIEGTSA